MRMLLASVRHHSGLVEKLDASGEVITVSPGRWPHDDNAVPQDAETPLRLDVCGQP